MFSVGDLVLNILKLNNALIALIPSNALDHDEIDDTTCHELASDATTLLECLLEVVKEEEQTM